MAPPSPQPVATRVIGGDLAWGEGTSTRAANETGVVAVNGDGTVVDTGWTIGIEDTIGWIARLALPNTLLMVDAPPRRVQPVGPAQL